VKKEYNEKNYYDVGKKCLVDYYNTYFPFEESKIIALEQRLLFKLGEYKIIGFIDRLGQREDGTYEIRDYKTNGTLPEQAKMEENRQLALYEIGLKQLWDDVENTELIWHFLRFNKEIKVKKTPEQLKKLEEDVVSKITEIEEATEMDNFPARESVLCKWCDYQDICPHYKHIYKTEQMPLNKFYKDDGVKLVNEYRDLTEQRKMIQNEIEQVKEAIVKYAKENELEVIRGSDRKLRVKIKEEVGVPTKTSNPEQYSQLEQLLRESPYWKDNSKLDATALIKHLKQGEVDKDLQEKIKQLLVEKRTEALYLSKLKEERE